jgi:NTE family protein
MASIGLVLSAGGGTARAYQSGVLAALSSETGWDPRSADLVVGTSAGSSTAAFLRSGLAASDDFARHVGEPLSDEAQTLLSRPPVLEPPPLRGDTDREWARGRPLRWSLAVRALGGGVSPVAGLAGLAPRGIWSNTELGGRIRAVAGERWPEAPTWVCAVRVRDGRRVVFGRDDVPTPDLATAVRASCAVPRIIEPVTIHGDEFIDGAVQSSTNADLVAGLAFDLVVVVSSMTAVPSAVTFSPKAPGMWWFSRVARREIAAVRARGSAVLVIEPTAADLTARRRADATTETVARQARRSTIEALVRPENAAAVALLKRTAAFARSAADQ